MCVRLAELIKNVGAYTAIGAAFLASAAQGATLAPLASFGGGDGWRAPFEVLPGDTAGTDSLEAGFYNYLGNTLTNTTVNGGNLERGMAYNPTTGNLIVVSRSTAGNGIRILNGTTGVDVGSLNQGSGVIAGGTFTTNMVGVADDGAIYVGNLTTNATTSAFNVYRWENETAATPTLVYTGAPLAGARIGDSFDVFGSGTQTRIAVGYGNAPSVPGNNSFALLTTADGTTFTAASIGIASNPPEAGDFRLGITFTDADTIIGKQGSGTAGQEQFARQVDVSGATGTLALSIGSDGAALRPLDYAIVDGRPLLAMVEASSSTAAIARARLFVYDQTNPTGTVAERKIAEGSNLPINDPVLGPNQFPNGNGTGSVKFGAVTGNSVVVYAMSTNNGIQAFTLTLDPIVPPADDADFNSDGIVDGSDFLIWQRGYGLAAQTDNTTGDANGDGNVNDADLTIWNGQFGTVPAAAALGAIPEPSALVMAGLGVACLALRRWNN
ncbi:dockerin type I domain-containing protein [Lacipirellula limnantheis]|uniref:Ice-binding protein C-terminal domain-containing protein n=1 Tax=Lacipirellula limnantheis TaxID=2528024 RepID=A0A517U166_9BACT|nr:dockerin type I domain-containing protein [Lacipirellula limnantheis]QDT74364.1 hypothetical protein I41_35590 [Lacipirellula limnantheis]